MRNHIRSLCKKHTIKRYWCKDKYGAYAFSYYRCIRIPPIKSDMTYAIALHEIGHILDGDSEIDAWVWAIENAVEWTKPMENMMMRCLQCHYDAMIDEI